MTMFPTTVKILEPRQYQIVSLDSLRGLLRNGQNRPILCMPTGAGKTIAAIHLIQEANEKGSHVTFVADRIALVDQASERLSEYGIPHGIAQGLNTRGRHEPIQVCSAQTIEKRDYWNELNLLIIDECHIQRKAIQKFAQNWGGPVVGLTATPLTDGLSDFYNGLVNSTTTDELLAQGWLAPLKIYAGVESDMTGAEIVGGEWTSKAVRERGRVIIGNIVDEWIKLTGLEFGGPVKTLVFSADVAHGAELCEAFQARGYDFRHSSYKDDDKVTRRLIEGFRRGDYIGLISVDRFSRGFDVPDVECIIGARNYRKSLASVLQQMGRGMRISPEKTCCLYLDFSGNIAGWYEEISEIWANGVAELPKKDKKKPIRKEGQQRFDSKCKQCGYTLPPGTKGVCPYCGAERPRRRSTVEHLPGRMEEVTRPGSREWQENKRWVWQQLSTLALERKGGDEVSAKRFALAQYKSLYDEWPSWDGLMPTGNPVDDRVARKVRQQLTIYYKKKGG